MSNSYTFPVVRTLEDAVDVLTHSGGVGLDLRGMSEKERSYLLDGVMNFGWGDEFR